MYDTNIKMREKISFVRDLMDYKMRECLIKAYNVAFCDGFGENWFDEYIEEDKKKTYKIATYENDVCVWINGLSHADFVAAIKILIYSDKKYQEAFFKYWGFDRNKNDKKVLLIAKELHAFRNDISHINAETDYSILTPDRAIENMWTLVNLCEGLRDDNGYLYSDIFAYEYKRYKVMSKTYYVKDLINKLNIHMSHLEFVEICKKYSVELSIDEQFVVVEDIDRLMSIILSESQKKRKRKMKSYLWGTAILMAIMLIGVLLIINKFNNRREDEKISKDDYTKEDEVIEYEQKNCLLVIQSLAITNEGVCMEIDISNSNSLPITTDMYVEATFYVIEKSGNGKEVTLPLGIDKQIESKQIEDFTYVAEWEQLKISKDMFGSIILREYKIYKMKK